MPLELAVIGGAGMIGRRIVDEALARGHRVRVIVRDPSRIPGGDERLEVVRGDVLAVGLGGLLEGRDAVVSAVGTARAEAPDSTVYVRAAGALVEALRGLGTSAPRLIVVGGVGSLADENGRLVLERVPDDRRSEHEGQKAALDLYRTVSDVSWTYVSPPGRIAPGERTGRYRIGADDLVVDPNGVSSISMEDFAVAVLDEIEAPAHVRRRFTVGY
jgi:putative NADH-flavin reductase